MLVALEVIDWPLHEHLGAQEGEKENVHGGDW